MESCIGTFFVILRGSESFFRMDRSANLVRIIYLERTRRYLVSSLVRSFIRCTLHDKSFIVNSPLRSLYLFRSFPFIFSGCQRVSEYVSGVSEKGMYVLCKRQLLTHSICSCMFIKLIHTILRHIFLLSKDFPMKLKKFICSNYLQLTVGN